MNFRLSNDEVRVRLSRDEAAQLLISKRLSQTLHLSQNQSLSTSLIVDENVPGAAVDFVDAELRVRIDPATLEELLAKTGRDAAASFSVGVGEKTDRLKLVLEIDLFKRK